MKDITGGEFVGDFRNDYTTNLGHLRRGDSLRSVHRGAQPRPCRPDGILTLYGHEQWSVSILPK
jgi:hypothetical protein